MNGIEIIATLLGGYQLHAVVERFLEPQRIEIVLRYAQQQRNGQRLAHGGLRERTRGIARRGHDKYASGRLVETAAYAVRLGLLEGTGGHLRPLFREIAAERNIEVIESQMGGQSLAFVGYRCGRPLQGTPDGKPVAELVNSAVVAPYIDALHFIFGSDKGRGIALPVLKHQTIVFEHASRSHTAQFILRRPEIFHIYLFGLDCKYSKIIFAEIRKCMSGQRPAHARKAIRLKQI